ncbi:M20 metallopeptidase family protein [Anaerosacchariphilus polymeriproducens]|uniref:Amidohydrolase n=1 Tax=Anaerosacchariphilus polymeriproducens TaxID=1812858 RepID=A0A371AYQ9_9FIRM|nr:M20 family metallopeptidase [Anaerosacchariphilus polymeriproducens]RDU24632.1 amidohydrolase [Anaerosacchariphilus polymeriproducens]
MKILLDEAKKLQDTIVSHRRYMHENAEISINLPLTTKYVIKNLKDMGYEPIEICKSGIVAIAGKQKTGKTFMLRADMDALPIMEETNLPFKSKTNNMHACGHDLHTAMLLGAAQLLKDHEDELEGQVKLMFQPAEETMGGAKDMIDAGLLENPKVDAAMMIHVFTGVPAPAGLVVVTDSGIVSASSDWFKVTVQGKGGHGAIPNLSIDPLNIISHIHIALQSINAREIASGDNAVLTIGHMCGGNAANVIPDSAFLSGTIRTFSQEKREFIKKRLEEISKGIASTFRGEAEVEFLSGCPSVINNEDLNNQFNRYSRELLGSQQTVNATDVAGEAFSKFTGSEDFAFVSELVPSVMTLLGTTSEKPEYIYPLHHPKAVFNEDPLYIGAALYANTAIEWLKNNM